MDYIKNIEKIRKELNIHKDQRIGQNIWNCLAMDNKIKAPEGDYLFFMSDEEFVSMLDKFDKY